MKNPTIKLPGLLAGPTELVGGLNGGIRDSRPIVGGMRLSEAAEVVLNGENVVSKTARKGQPHRRVVRQVLNGERRED